MNTIRPAPSGVSVDKDIYPRTQTDKSATVYTIRQLHYTPRYCGSRTETALIQRLHYQRSPECPQKNGAAAALNVPPTYARDHQILLPQPKKASSKKTLLGNLKVRAIWIHRTHWSRDAATRGSVWQDLTVRKKNSGVKDKTPAHFSSGHTFPAPTASHRHHSP